MFKLCLTHNIAVHCPRNIQTSKMQTIIYLVKKIPITCQIKMGHQGNNSQNGDLWKRLLEVEIFFVSGEKDLFITIMTLELLV